MLLWGVAAPTSVALIILILAHATARSLDEELRERRLALAVPAALALAYTVGHLGLEGAPGLGVEGGLLSVTLGATAVALGLALANPGPRAAALIRLLTSGAAAWVLLSPLSQPQGWSAAQFAAHLGLAAVANMVVWIGLERLLRQARGPAAPMALGVLVAGSSGVVVLGALAFTARLLAPLAAGLGVLFLASWAMPRARLLRAAAPLLALNLVSHWTAALFYGELPPLSLTLLVLAPLPLLLLRSGAVQRAGRAATLAAALLLAGLPLTGAAVPAAMTYFRTTTTADTGDQDDNYGY